MSYLSHVRWLVHLQKDLLYVGDPGSPTPISPTAAHPLPLFSRLTRHICHMSDTFAERFAEGSTICGRTPSHFHFSCCGAPTPTLYQAAHKLITLLLPQLLPYALSVETVLLFQLKTSFAPSVSCRPQTSQLFHPCLHSFTPHSLDARSVTVQTLLIFLVSKTENLLHNFV